MLKVGEYQVHCFIENRFYLDGGMMFGVVPKTMWEKMIPPNEKNLIPMDVNLFLLKYKNKNILLDAGFGDTLNDKERKLYTLYTPSTLDVELLNFGVRPEDIDMVIFSHMHADHGCGAIKKDENGRETLRFPRAKHFVQKREWEEATHPDERTKAAYLLDHIQILAQNSALEIVEGEAEILPGLRIKNTGGHTPGHQGVFLEGNGEKLIYYADIIPTTAHLRTAYVASIDLNPRETMKIKKEIIPFCLEKGCYVAFDHDLKVKIGKLKIVNEKVIAEPIVS